MGVVWGSGCGTVGIAIAFNTGGPRIESSHQLYFVINIYFLLTVVEKIELRKRDIE